VDRITPEHRSWNMSRIKGKDTTPEKLVRSMFHKAGLRFRIHRKDLPGTPDIVLPMYNSVVFVHGCFWHRHEKCKNAALPKSNTEFWKEKFELNVIRDEKNAHKLRSMGWSVYIIWECEVSDEQHIKGIIRQILKESYRSNIRVEDN